jgi:hypothetical protein
MGFLMLDSDLYALATGRVASPRRPPSQAEPQKLAVHELRIAESESRNDEVSDFKMQNAKTEVL